MDKLKIVYKKISDLTPYGNNPRLNDGAVDAVAKSIEEFGFKVPIVIDKDGVYTSSFKSSIRDYNFTYIKKTYVKGFGIRG